MIGYDWYGWPRADGRKLLVGGTGTGRRGWLGRYHVVLAAPPSPLLAGGKAGGKTGGIASGVGGRSSGSSNGRGGPSGRPSGE